jgi:chorismate mutase
MMFMRGVRGAITVTSDDEQSILEATTALLKAMIDTNGIQESDVASVIFTTTPDLTAVFPAKAARELGWTQTALMGMQEMPVRDALPLCIRILIHWNTTKDSKDIHHIYLNEAVNLRPDRQNGVIGNEL